MARLPALIDDLAEHDGRGRPTVELIARNIREEGLIQTTKRGRGAAEMTAADAAALLIGLCVAETPKSAPDAVRTFTALVPMASNLPYLIEAYSTPTDLELVAKADTFGSALTELLKSVGYFSHKITDKIAPIYTDGKTLGVLERYALSEWSHFEVSFSLPIPAAHISIRWHDVPGGEGLFKFDQGYGRRELPPLADQVRERALDRTTTVKLDLKPFERIHRLLTTKPPPKRRVDRTE